MDGPAQLRIIWIAFLVAVAVYAPIPWLVIGAGADDAAPATEAVRSGLHAGALGAGLASFLSRRWWSNAVAAAAQSGGEAFIQLRTGCLVTWAVSETVALIGLGLALITRQPAEAVPFAAVAVLLLWFHRPAKWPPLTAPAGGGAP